MLGYARSAGGLRLREEERPSMARRYDTGWCRGFVQDHGRIPGSAEPRSAARAARAVCGCMRKSGRAWLGATTQSPAL